MSALVPFVLGFGARTWALPDSTLEILWPGPGSGLLIGRPSQSNGPVAPITHPTGAGPFATATEAQRAVEAFVRAATDDQAGGPRG